MEKNRKKQIVVLSIALVCIFILVFSLFHKSATKDSANPPLTNVLTDSISQIVSACPGEIGVAVMEGRKTMTRRIIIPQPDFLSDNFGWAKRNNGDVILPK